MSTVLYIDAFAGIAGDMTVAALLHAGAPLDDVRAELATLPLHGWRARTESVWRGAFAATRFIVEPDGAPSSGAGGPPEAGAHDHRHGHAHDHGHEHGHSARSAHAPDGLDAWPGQPSRDWRTIRSMLEAAALHPRVRSRALAAFGVLAEAEARVHGLAVDAVTFHEVGAIDSIIDIVGACAAMECLDIDTIIASPLPMGHGRVHTEHGPLPIPVPAVVELLRGWSVEPSPWAGELVTPTGAALVAGLATCGPLPAMRIQAVGYGAGTRNPGDHANVLRVVIGEGASGSATTVVELRAQVDDLPGEGVPLLIEAMFAAGAIDAWVTPIVMKKGRPALLIGALTTPDRRAPVGDALLRNGGTFGYRYETLAREVLARRHVTVPTPWGTVRVKLAERGGEVFHAAPEYEDCAGVARAAGVSLARVMGAALSAWERG